MTTIVYTPRALALQNSQPENEPDTECALINFPFPFVALGDSEQSAYFGRPTKFDEQEFSPHEQPMSVLKRGARYPSKLRNERGTYDSMAIIV